MESININDKEYKIEDLDENQTYCVSQLQDLNSKEANLKFQMDQIAAAKKVFTDTLISLVEEEKE